MSTPIKANSIFRWMVVLALVIPAMVTIFLPAPVLAATTTLVPIADSTDINLTPSGGGPNWLAASASGGQYVYTSVNGWIRDHYVLSDVALTGTINSVTVWISARDGSSSSQARPSLRVGGANYPGTNYTTAGTWTDYSTTWPTNPVTTTAWTWADMNALEAGVNLRYQGTGGQTQCDRVWVVIDYTPDTPATSVSVFPGIYIGIAAALGIGILVYFMRRRPISRKG